jgi:hypothetical protein
MDSANLYTPIRDASSPISKNMLYDDDLAVFSEHLTLMSFDLEGKGYIHLSVSCHDGGCNEYNIPVPMATPRSRSGLFAEYFGSLCSAYCLQIF